MPLSDSATSTDSHEEVQSRSVETHIAAYERGLERGLHTAEQQVRMAGELARTVLTASAASGTTATQPRLSFARLSHRSVMFLPVISRPSTVLLAPYAPYSYGRFSHYSRFSPYSRFSHRSYGYGFRHGRFPRHAHLSPSRHRRHRSVFFPRGHFSSNGFLFGHGLVLR